MKSKMANLSNAAGNENFEYEVSCFAGMLAFTIDSGDSVQVKFSERIKVEVIFDHLESNVNSGSFTANKQDDIENASQLYAASQNEIVSDKSEPFLTAKHLEIPVDTSNLPDNDNDLVSGCSKESRSGEYEEDLKSFSSIDDKESYQNGFDSDRSSNKSIEMAILTDSCIGNQNLNVISPHSNRTVMETGDKGYRNKEDSDVRLVEDHDPPKERSSSTRGKLRRSTRLQVQLRKVKLSHSFAKLRAKRKSLISNESSKTFEEKEHSEKQSKWKNSLYKDSSEDQVKKFKLTKKKEKVNEVKKSKIDQDNDAKHKDMEAENIEEAGENHKDAKVSQESLPKKKKTRLRKRKLLLQKDVKCTYCDVTFETKQDFFNHRRSKGSSHPCQICGKIEPYEGFLMVHMQSHNPQKGHLSEDNDNEDERSKKVLKRKCKMKCDICGLVVSTLDSLKVHSLSHTGEYPYKCCICEDQRFSSLSSLQYHLEGHKSAEGIQCKLCNMTFASRAELAKHQFTHELKCGLCQEIFPNLTSRNHHYSIAHPKDIFKCNECFRLFPTDAEYQNHMLYHQKRKREQCPKCGVVVARLKSHMAVHMKKEQDKMLACDQCTMKFQSKSALNKHLRTHSGERPYECNKCTKRFRSHGVLKKHLITHMSNLERGYVCDVCGKRCSLRSNLTMHMRIHSDIRPFTCTFCPQAFNYKNSLNIHIKAKHANQNQSSFKCPHCPQTFQDNALCTSHILNQHSQSNGAENIIKPPPVATSSATPKSSLGQLGSSQMTFNGSSMPHLQPYSGGDHNSPILANDNNNTLAMPPLGAASSIPPRPLTSYVNPMMASSSNGSMARGQILSYLGRDRLSQMGRPPSLLPGPPALHNFLPVNNSINNTNANNSIGNNNIHNIGMDHQHSNSHNSLPPVHSLPPVNSFTPTHAFTPVHSLTPANSFPPSHSFTPAHSFTPVDALTPVHAVPSNNGGFEANGTLNIRGPQDSSPADNQTQYSVYHNL